MQADGASARHTVNVQAGGTASLVVPMGAAAPGGPVSGWLAVKAPFTLEIREQGRLLGTTETDRIMMASGRHELELVNEALGYRSTPRGAGRARARLPVSRSICRRASST